MRSFKYTNSKGDSINIGPNSVPTTLDDNLGSYWNANTLPVYPDNPAGTTYLWANGTTLDGWYGVYASVAVSNNIVVATATGAGGYFNLTRAFTSFGGKSVRICFVANFTGTINVKGTIDGVDTVIKAYSVTADVPVTFDGYIAGAVTNLYLSSPTHASGNTMAIVFCYIGDGTYSTKLIDISGDWNFLNVYGGTPVSGLAGKALSFNGSTNYLRSANTLTSIPDLWRFHVRFPLGNAQSATSSMTLVNYLTTSTSAGFLWCYRNVSTDNLIISYCNGSAQATITASSFFIGYTAARVDASIEVNWSSSPAVSADGTTIAAYSVRVYRNGVVFNTYAMTTPVKPLLGGYLYIGAYQGASSYLSGIAEGFVVGSVALTSSEHWALYSNYSIPYKTTGETSYGIVESVEGIDYPDSDLQTTKAPYQDGKTYLDTLLSPREVTIEGIIPVPNAIDTINSNKKAILDVLNAKYGTGTLDYYYGLNTIQHRVLKNVTVDSVKFANRVMPEATQRYQINFLANNPYFYESTLSPYAIEILSGNSATLTVGGENNTPCFIRIYGSATNPTITNVTTGETISLTYSLAGGSYIDIDTTFGNKTVKLNGSTNLIGYLDLTSTFFQLQPGSPVLSYSGGGYIIITWYNRYIGV